DVLAGPAAKIEVAKSPLRDRDRVVLAANSAVIIEQRYAFGVVWAGIVRLGFKAHVVLAKLLYGGAGIRRRLIVPESQLASSRKTICDEHTPVIVYAVGQRHKSDQDGCTIARDHGRLFRYAPHSR